MMAVRAPRGQPRFHAVPGEAGHVLRAAYAWGLLRLLLGAVDATGSGVGELGPQLTWRLSAETDARANEPKPLTDLLCDALGPGARWAGIAEGIPPFEFRPVRPEARWWYAPWGQDGARAVLDPANLHQILACAATLAGLRMTWDGGDLLKVGPWTGMVHVSERHPNEEIRDRDLLLLPWPWPVRRGLRSADLGLALRKVAAWGLGRPNTRLGSPRRRVVPIAAWPLPESCDIKEIELPTGWPAVMTRDWIARPKP